MHCKIRKCFLYHPHGRVCETEEEVAAIKQKKDEIKQKEEESVAAKVQKEPKFIKDQTPWSKTKAQRQTVPPPNAKVWSLLVVCIAYQRICHSL